MVLLIRAPEGLEPSRSTRCSAHRMTLSASRTGHPPIEDVGGATSTSAGSPPITQITFLTCRAQYPGGPNRCVSVSSLSARPSPVNRRVGIHDFTFEACSSFTRVTACKIARPPKGGLYPEASTRSVTRPSRSVATMLIDIYMDGFSLHWRSAPLRRTVNYRVGLVVRVPEKNSRIELFLSAFGRSFYRLVRENKPPLAALVSCL